MDVNQAVALARDGNEDGYRWLFNRYYGRLARYLRAAFRLEGDEVSDVTQEAFINGFSNIDQLRDPGRFFSWVVTIGRNRALALIMRARREDRMTDSFLLEIDNLRYQDAAEREQLGRLVSEVIEKLPAGEVKETVRAYYLEGGQTVDRLAARFGTPRGTITARLKRFRDAVKKPLARKLLELGYGTSMKGQHDT